MKKTTLILTLAASLVVGVATVLTPVTASASEETYIPIGDDVESGNKDLTTKKIGKVECNKSSFTYTGSPIKISEYIQVYDTEGNRLEWKKDYGIRYENNVNAGKATAIVEGICYCAGTEEFAFNIEAADMKNTVIKKIPVQKYTGKAVCPELKVSWKNRTLVEGVDYKVIYSNNKKAGTATAKVQGIGNFSGTKKANFTIKPLAVTPKLVLNKQNITLSVKQNATLKVTLTGIAGGVKWSSDNKKVAKVSSSGKVTAVATGTATITVTSNKNKKIKATCKVIVTEKNKVEPGNSVITTNSNVSWKNVLITDYTQMKKFIKAYTSRKGIVNSKLLTKLKSYNSAYFKKKAVCINEVMLTNGVDVKIQSVSMKKIPKNKYDITVNLKKVDNRGADVVTTDMVSHVCFVEIPIEKAKNGTVQWEFAG